MAERETLAERKTETPIPFREFVVGIYKEKKKLVVRKFEVFEDFRVCLDEQHALNIEDAIVIQNIIIHKIHNFSLN
ncbi:MAG: hypothetical protein PHT07_21135 [Paludibacter sp.]|nr:hypothetical protein [Paludibacter sp.]